MFCGGILTSIGARAPALAGALTCDSYIEKKSQITDRSCIVHKQQINSLSASEGRQQWNNININNISCDIKPLIHHLH